MQLVLPNLIESCISLIQQLSPDYQVLCAYIRGISKRLYMQRNVKQMTELFNTLIDVLSQNQKKIVDQAASLAAKKMKKSKFNKMKMSK